MMKTKISQKPTVRLEKRASWSVSAKARTKSSQTSYVLMSMQILEKPEPIPKKR